MFGDFKIIGVFVKIEALRGFFLLYEITAVDKVGHFINACACFGKCADQFIVCVKLLVSVRITVNGELRPGKFVVGIIFIGLGELHRPANQRIFDFNLNHRTVFIDIDSKRFFRKDKACRGLNLTHDPISIGYIGKRKNAVLGRGSGHNRIFGCKLGTVRFE